MVNRAAQSLGRKGGKVGGKTTGATKVRGDADHYRALAAKRRCGKVYSSLGNKCDRSKGHEGPCA